MNTARPIRLTPARKRALQVLLAAHRAGSGPLRVSNETNASCVYWQSAAWLAREGLAVIVVMDDYIELTDAGRHVAGQVSA